jgi:1,4-alpha-glucan branching enzyme
MAKPRAKADAKPEPLLSPEAVERLAAGHEGDPFSVLGMHGGGAQPLSVRAMLPGAESVRVLDQDGNERAQLARLHQDGVFAGAIEGAGERFAYRLGVRRFDREEVIEDPYRFPQVLGDLDIHLLGEGRHLHLHERLGAHPREMEGVAGVAFAVWAPNARRVSVVGPFNNWDGRTHPMRLRHGVGVWELFLPGLEPGQFYKYEIIGRDGQLLPLKTDPFAFYCEKPPETASVIHGLPRIEWQDAEWMLERAGHQALDAPISIYECHLGSWMRADGRYLTYEELAEQLVPYVKEMGFTHIECLPVSEHPFSGSWGYQPLGLFAPTSRFGTPEAFGRFVDRCHQAGLGLVIDWVPGHFPTDPHGLGLFDGTALYEHSDPRQGFHRDWQHADLQLRSQRGTNFLLSNALYLARALPYRRAAGRCGGLHALSRLQPRGRRVGAQRVRRQREPRRGGLPEAPERACLRRIPGLHHHGRGIDRLAGRSRGRCTSAGWASATSGTWAGCTTRCST